MADDLKLPKFTERDLGLIYGRIERDLGALGFSTDNESMLAALNQMREIVSSPLPEITEVNSETFKQLGRDVAEYVENNKAFDQLEALHHGRFDDERLEITKDELEIVKRIDGNHGHNASGRSNAMKHMVRQTNPMLKETFAAYPENIQRNIASFVNVMSDADRLLRDFVHMKNAAEQQPELVEAFNASRETAQGLRQEPEIQEQEPASNIEQQEPQISVEELAAFNDAVGRLDAHFNAIDLTQENVLSALLSPEATMEDAQALAESGQLFYARLGWMVNDIQAVIAPDKGPIEEMSVEAFEVFKQDVEAFKVSQGFGQFQMMVNGKTDEQVKAMIESLPDDESQFGQAKTFYKSLPIEIQNNPTDLLAILLDSDQMLDDIALLTEVDQLDPHLNADLGAAPAASTRAPSSTSPALGDEYAQAADLVESTLLSMGKTLNPIIEQRVGEASEQLGSLGPFASMLMQGASKIALTSGVSTDGEFTSDAALQSMMKVIRGPHFLDMKSQGEHDPLYLYRPEIRAELEEKLGLWAEHNKELVIDMAIEKAPEIKGLLDSGAIMQEDVIAGFNEEMSGFMGALDVLHAKGKIKEEKVDLGTQLALSGPMGGIMSGVIEYLYSTPFGRQILDALNGLVLKISGGKFNLLDQFLPKEEQPSSEAKNTGKAEPASKNTTSESDKVIALEQKGFGRVMALDPDAADYEEKVEEIARALAEELTGILLKPGTAEFDAGVESLLPGLIDQLKGHDQDNAPEVTNEILAQKAAPLSDAQVADSYFKQHAFNPFGDEGSVVPSLPETFANAASGNTETATPPVSKMVSSLPYGMRMIPDADEIPGAPSSQFAKAVDQAPVVNALPSGVTMTMGFEDVSTKGTYGKLAEIKSNGSDLGHDQMGPPAPDAIKPEVKVSMTQDADGIPMGQS